MELIINNGIIITLKENKGTTIICYRVIDEKFVPLVNNMIKKKLFYSKNPY